MSLQTCLFIIGWIRNDQLIIFTKTREVEFIPAPLIPIISSYIIIIAFHLHDRTVWIIIILHVHWTKLQYASILFKGEDKVIWVLCYINNNAYEIHSTFSSWSSPLAPPKKWKEIKLFTRESSQQAKEERGIFFGFLLILLLQAWKVN